MELALFQVDAFTSRLFGGNPAAIVPLESEWLADQTLQNIAAENNLAETAFFIHKGGEQYDLRWFTPALEIDLCGHATLASAHVIFQRLQPELQRVVFSTRSGKLTVSRADAGRMSMDFPARPGEPGAVDSRLKAAIGGKPAMVLNASRDYLVVYETEAEVRALQPDMRELKLLDRIGVIATAPGVEVDFVSRFFAPAAGIDEDPVTGSAHCTLVPYWAERLGKNELTARQISARVGDLWCTLQGDRVTMAGHAVEYLRGTVYLPA
jgi:PhzF family phenazine biosynthesis protein